MFRRHNAIVLALCLPIVGLLSAGCEEEEKRTPQVIFEGRLERGGPQNNCRDSGTLFTVGSFGNPAADTKVPSEPVPDGQSFNGAAVAVSCSVKSLGADEFEVIASVFLGGAEGGIFRVDGKFKPTGEQTGIHASFASRKTGNTYDQVDRACVVRYSVSPMGVASGRVWGEITCPSASNDKAETACQGVAQFRFENCAE